MPINRTFQDIPEGKLREADQQSFLIGLGWSRGVSWQELLESKRVLVVSEAGAGKTHECRAMQQRLWGRGEPAFFVELASLAASDLRNMLDHEEERRPDAWLVSQSDVATFFLDSIDELKLTLGSFEQALKKLGKALEGHLGRARIVITTRPVPFDRNLVRRILPVPRRAEPSADADSFARTAMRQHEEAKETEETERLATWRTVALMPLSDNQIVDFARDQGVTDGSKLLEDLRRRNAQDFARRPEDLIELCADWKHSKRIRNHREQISSNVRVKLQPREGRHEAAELSIERAIDGASRLALALSVTRRLTIRHSAKADVTGADLALDPALILSDWSPDELKALLERPLFVFASYGRVRFHHRSVLEYLAARRVRALQEHGLPIRAIKRLLFAETRGRQIVRPSKRPLAGWLALEEAQIFEWLRDHEPAVLLSEGDPASLSLAQRSQALRAYVERYGSGGWRGLEVPAIQAHRFASPELGQEIERLFEDGIENPEVRELLLSLVEAGEINNCADLAHVIAIDPDKSHGERIAAIDALSALRDPRLNDLAASAARDVDLWPDQLARTLMFRLFPQDLPVERLCEMLARLKEPRRNEFDLGWPLPRMIADAALDAAQLQALRDGLVALASAGLRWQEQWPHIASDRPELSRTLAATCSRGLESSVTKAWLSASALALLLPHRTHGDDDALRVLRQSLAALSAADNEQLFWVSDELLCSVHTFDDPWMRLARIALHDGPVTLDPDRDLGWVRAALAETDRPLKDRAMLLEAAMRLIPTDTESPSHLLGLKPLVADDPGLTRSIDDRLGLPKENPEEARWRAEQTKRKKQQEDQEAKDRASWVRFWQEVANRPDDAFSAERSGDTAWNLWRAMGQDGDTSRSSGWNRRFIEAHFGKATADRLRTTLMGIWRKEQPTLRSERADDEKNTYLVRWQLGLAAIYAEAEEVNWAANLTQEEAETAARYAPIELNDLPPWMDDLLKFHPTAVETILGRELTSELEAEPLGQGHSMLLQGICNASNELGTAFLQRLLEWLTTQGRRGRGFANKAAAAQRTRQAIEATLKHGGSEEYSRLLTAARTHLEANIDKELAYVWLSTLMRLDAMGGVDALEERIRDIEPSERSEAVTWFSVLFGDRHDAVNLAGDQFAPQLLLRLLRLAYRHVRPQDDARHHAPYTPDTRDDAERARNELVSALLNARGEEGWQAKLEMAADPLCEHFKDRILAVAEERLAEEADSVAFDDAQAISLDQRGEAPASTNEAMFRIMVDRLDDLDELLLSDASPREAWAGCGEERVMRREIARELRRSANGLYNVDQEAVTADEKETDIRLRSTASEREAVIELKIADDRSARDLRDTIPNQLVKKYMAPETSRSGCLLITLSKSRGWRHPESGCHLGLADLTAMLREEAARAVDSMGGSARIHVHVLDLRARLPTESGRNKAGRAKS